MRPLTLDRLDLGPSDRINHVYLLSDPGVGEAAVVDPAWDVVGLKAACDRRGVRLSTIALTHSHADHCNAADELAARTGASIHIHVDEAAFAGDRAASYRRFRDGDLLAAGRFALSCIHTPGHTPGSTCFLAGDRLFTGDTLFNEGCGYTHLRGGDPKALFQSLQMLKARIPAHCMVYPGHTFRRPAGLAFSEVRRINPYLRFQGLAGFVQFSGLRAPRGGA
jgi:glyoxylase-like metal-dependent hydrolase (beta-lactamase superfamily II)